MLALSVAFLAGPASAATARTVTIKANPSVAAVRSAEQITGTVSSSPRGTAVLLQRKTGTSWTTIVSSSTTNRRGAYAMIMVLPGKVGTYAFRVVAPAKGSLKRAVSPVVRIPALTPVTATIAANTYRVPAGSTVTLSGSVRPFVAGTVVALQKLVGLNWVTVSSTTLSATGHYAKAVTTTAPTLYRSSVGRVGTRAPASSFPVWIDTTPVIGTSALPHGTIGVAYSTTLTAIGNPAGTWAASPLPAGLTLNTGTGRISGTPTGQGNTDTAVVVHFTQTSTKQAAPAKTLNLHIGYPPPVITTNSLPDGVQHSAYSTTLSAVTGSGGSATGTWSASPLPAGLTLDTTTGTISGTPTASGDTQVVIGFTETSTATPAATKTLLLHIAPRPAPAITTTSLPPGKYLNAYSATLTVVNSPGGTWSVTGLPGGYKVDASTGEISASALDFSAGKGTYALTVTYTRTDDGAIATANLSLTIN